MKLLRARYVPSMATIRAKIVFPLLLALKTRHAKDREAIYMGKMGYFWHRN